MQQSSVINRAEEIDTPDSQRANLMQNYPFLPSERYELVSGMSRETISSIRGKYGEEIAAMASCDLSGELHESPQIREAQLYARHGMQALEMTDVGIVLPQDIQTGLLLARKSPQSIETLKGLKQNMQRGINGVQIHRSGVTGIEANPVNVFMPSALNIEDVMHTYMTSVPQTDPENGQTESQMQQKLFQERKNAFVLYKDLISASQLQGLHASDLQGILEICFRLTNGQQPTFVLTTGFGGSEDQPSTRMPSYISGACEIIRIFLKHKENGTINTVPKFRVLNAHKIAGLVNDMDSERIGLSAQDMQRVLRAFVDRFAPDIAEHTYFETDEAISYPNLTEAKEYFAHLPADHPSHQRISVQAERMMKKERLSNPEDAVHRVQQYIAAHISIFLDVIASDWHGSTSYADHKPDVVWSIGGKGEHFFNEFRRMFSEDRQGPDHLHNSYHPLSVRTLQKAGQHPPYYHLHPVDTSIYALNGEAIVPDVKTIKDKAVAKSIDADYKAMLSMVKDAVAKERGVAISTISDTEADSVLKSFFLSIEKPA